MAGGEKRPEYQAQGLSALSTLVCLAAMVRIGSLAYGTDDQSVRLKAKTLKAMNILTLDPQRWHS